VEKLILTYTKLRLLKLVSCCQTNISTPEILKLRLYIAVECSFEFVQVMPFYRQSLTIIEF